LQRVADLPPGTQVVHNNLEAALVHLRDGDTAAIVAQRREGLGVVRAGHGGGLLAGNDVKQLNLTSVADWQGHVVGTEAANIPEVLTELLVCGEVPHRHIAFDRLTDRDPLPIRADGPERRAIRPGAYETPCFADPCRVLWIVEIPGRKFAFTGERVEPVGIGRVE
jgi:hypothetical protein